MHDVNMSQIDSAVRGTDNRIQQFLTEKEGFTWASLSGNGPYLVRELTDAYGRPIEVQVRPALIITVIYYGDGSGVVYQQNTESYRNYQEFQESYQKTMDFLREAQA